MWEVIVEYQIYPTYIFELIAAIAGVFYLWKSKTITIDEKLLVYYLVFIFIADAAVMLYSIYGYVHRFKYFEFIIGTSFETHFWLYNILFLFTVSFLTSFFVLLLKNHKTQRLFLILIAVYIIAAIVSYHFGVFFEKINAFSFISGSLLICLSIAFYYLEILNSNRILNFYKEIAFYASIGLLLYNLAIVPIYIYQGYVQTNSEFYELYNIVLKVANFTLYSMFVIGFVVKLYYLNNTDKKKN